jgi:hypothetical protein
MRIIITSAFPLDPSSPDLCNWELRDGPEEIFTETGTTLSLYSAFAEICQARARLAVHVTGEPDPEELFPAPEFSPDH